MFNENNILRVLINVPISLVRLILITINKIKSLLLLNLYIGRIPALENIFSAKAKTINGLNLCKSTKSSNNDYDEYTYKYKYKYNFKYK